MDAGVIIYDKIENIMNAKSENYVDELILSAKNILKYTKLLEMDKQNIFKTLDADYKELLENAKKLLMNIIKKLLFLTFSDDDFNINLLDYDDIVDNVDNLLEVVSENLDIMTGKKKETKLINQEISHQIKLNKMKENFSFNYKDIVIDDFDIDNSYYAFIPKITVKHNNITELSGDILDARKLRDENKSNILINFANYYNDSHNKRHIQNPLFFNPYKDEITNFIDEQSNFYNNLTDIYNKNKPSFSFKETQDVTDTDKENEFIYYLHITKPANQTPLHFIQTEEELNMLLNTLNQEKIFSVDLEHHSKESYLGITCLLQISTLSEDYIIDTLKLRNILHALNDPFTNKNIVKIFHGCDYDIEWLQKDFGIYVVNIFDTGQASRILKFPSFALKYLLLEYCKHEADKKYQTADWRKRPLSDEMIKYARNDTHFLIYLYDKLKELLITKSVQEKNDNPYIYLSLCLKRSNEICMKSYQKPLVKNEDYYRFITYNSNRNYRELSIIKETYIFRDYVARKLDMSPDSILSKKSILKAAKIKGDFTVDSVFSVLNFNTPFLRFVNDYVEVIKEKLERTEKKMKYKGEEGRKNMEKEYIEKVKKILENDKQNLVNLKYKEDAFINGRLKEKSEEINTIKSSIKYNINDAAESKFLTSNECNTKIKDNNVFSDFNLINYLKGKHHIVNISFKQKNDIIIKEEKAKIAVNEDELEQKNKMKKMKDITDNEIIFKKLKENCKMEDSEDDNNFDIDEKRDAKYYENRAKVKKDMLEKEKKFRKNVIENKLSKYENESEYKFKGKKRKK